MSTVSQVTEGIYLIEPEEKPGNTCSVYLIIDHIAALIETGPAAQLETILQGLAQLGCSPNSINYLIPTHIHLDHGGGVGYAVRQFPQATVVLHERGAPHLLNPTKLISATKRVYGEDFEKELGPILAVPQERLQVVQDGDIILLGDRQLQVIYSPGHAPHQISLLDSISQGLFCGEALGSYFAQDKKLDFPAGPGDFDLELALETVARLREATPKILLFSHFGVVWEDADSVIRQADRTARDYRDIVLAALQAGEGLEQLFQRLDEHLGAVHTYHFRLFRRVLMRATAAGYMAYLQRRGLS